MMTNANQLTLHDSTEDHSLQGLPKMVGITTVFDVSGGVHRLYIPTLLIQMMEAPLGNKNEAIMERNDADQGVIGLITQV